MHRAQEKASAQREGAPPTIPDRVFLGSRYTLVTSA